jgi:hypothetical protein
MVDWDVVACYRYEKITVLTVAFWEARAWGGGGVMFTGVDLCGNCEPRIVIRFYLNINATYQFSFV